MLNLDCEEPNGGFSDTQCDAEFRETVFYGQRDICTKFNTAVESTGYIHCLVYAGPL